MSISRMERLNISLPRLEQRVQSGPTGALFSTDRTYRYLLWRTWDTCEPLVLFVGLNPSTADENLNDPTIRRCIAFAKRFGAGGVIVGNLFAYRATKPRDLFLASDPLGPQNDEMLVQATRLVSTTVACWGTHGSFLGRSAQVASLLGEVQCLGTTKAGQPRHPLYLRHDTLLRRFGVVNKTG